MKHALLATMVGCLLVGCAGAPEQDANRTRDLERDLAAARQSVAELRDRLDCEAWPCPCTAERLADREAQETRAAPGEKGAKP